MDSLSDKMILQKRIHKQKFLTILQHANTGTKEQIQKNRNKLTSDSEQKMITKEPGSNH